MKKEDFEKARELNSEITALEDAIVMSANGDYVTNFAIELRSKNIENFLTNPKRIILSNRLNEKIMPIVTEELNRLKEEFAEL